MRAMTIKEKDKSEFDHELNKYLSEFGDSVITVNFAMVYDSDAGNMIYAAMILLKDK